MSRRPRTRPIPALAAMVLALLISTSVGAQSPTPPTTSSSDLVDALCRAIATRLASLPYWAGELGAGLGSICDGLSGPTQPRPSLDQLIGQKLMVRMGGTRPSQKLLGRIRRGEVGGIVLLGSNIRDRGQLRKLTRRLQRAAREGGQPPLLIALDQEGGSVRRVPWAPPTMTVPEMGATGRSGVAYRQGLATARALDAVGVNTDLAPVADIPRAKDSFMLQQARVFSSRAGVTTRLADAFARGLADGGVLATMKHFPGIGLAVRDTDRSAGVIDASMGKLATDLKPYRRAIRHDVPLIMLSNATYTAYDPDAAAGWSRAIAMGLLRDELGFEGISITDSLDGTAHARDVSAGDLAMLAIGAGTDMVLLTGTEKTTDRIYQRLVAAARAGAFDRSELTVSWQRIRRTKERLGLAGAP
jgi:beta-N-acetylhexosaminidase